MLTDSPFLKKMISTGEEQIGKLASQIVSNERFVQSLHGAVAKALEAKGMLDRQVAGALSSMHLPTTADMKKLNDRLDELERIFEGLSAKVDAIAEKLSSK